MRKRQVKKNKRLPIWLRRLNKKTQKQLGKDKTKIHFSHLYEPGDSIRFDTIAGTVTGRITGTRVLTNRDFAPAKKMLCTFKVCCDIPSKEVVL